MEDTCPITEKPEKDKIALIMLSFNIIEISESAINLAPLVNSIVPKNKLYKKPGDKFNKFSIKLKAVLIRVLLFIILIITEK